jgi:hypothetical protein
MTARCRFFEPGSGCRQIGLCPDCPGPPSDNLRGPVPLPDWPHRITLPSDPSDPAARARDAQAFKLHGCYPRPQIPIYPLIFAAMSLALCILAAIASWAVLS